VRRQVLGHLEGGLMAERWVRGKTPDDDLVDLGCNVGPDAVQLL
jgi:hypothetical protein